MDHRGEAQVMDFRFAVNSASLVREKREIKANSQMLNLNYCGDGDVMY